MKSVSLRFSPVPGSTHSNKDFRFDVILARPWLDIFAKIFLKKFVKIESWYLEDKLDDPSLRVDIDVRLVCLSIYHFVWKFVFLRVRKARWGTEKGGETAIVVTVRALREDLHVLPKDRWQKFPDTEICDAR